MGNQADNECWCGNSYGKYGSSSDCTNCSEQTGPYGGWVNCVSVINDDTNLINMQREPATLEQFLPTQAGYCVDEFGRDQNSDVIKLWETDCGPSEEKKLECVEKCIAASAVLRVTGCEAIWGQSNRGCYIHTQPIASGNGVDRHSCWVL